jgi:hypothetical protein
MLEAKALAISMSMASKAIFETDRTFFRDKAVNRGSANAEKTQIRIAISVYGVVAIIKQPMQLDLSLEAIMQIYNSLVSRKG